MLKVSDFSCMFFTVSTLILLLNLIGLIESFGCCLIEKGDQEPLPEASFSSFFLVRVCRLTVIAIRVWGSNYFQISLNSDWEICGIKERLKRKFFCVVLYCSKLQLKTYTWRFYEVAATDPLYHQNNANEVGSFFCILVHSPETGAHKIFQTLWHQDWPPDGVFFIRKESDFRGYMFTLAIAYR